MEKNREKNLKIGKNFQKIGKKYLEFFMNIDDPGPQCFTPDSTHFYFFQLQKLLSCPEKFFDDCQTIHETVETFEYQVFLKIPCFGFFVPFEIGGQFPFEFRKSVSKSLENLQCQQNFVQSFFNFNLKMNKKREFQALDLSYPFNS